MSDTPPPPPGPPSEWAPPPPPGSSSGWAPPAAPPPPGIPGALPPPPSTPGYGYGYAPGGPTAPARPLGGLATALTVLLAAAAATSALVAFAFFNRASVLDDLFSLTPEEADDADNLVAGSFVLYLLVLLATGIVWIVWQHRHAKNAEVLGKRDGLGAGWAIGGWFIPLANVGLGPLQLFQSAKWSDTTAPPGQGRAPTAVVVWWIAFAVNFVFGFAGGFQPDEAETLAELEDLRSQDQLAGFGSIVTIAAALCAIAAVRACTRRQQAALAARGITV